MTANATLVIAIDPQATANGLHQPGQAKSMVVFWNLALPEPAPTTTTSTPAKSSPASAGPVLAAGFLALAFVVRSRRNG